MQTRYLTVQLSSSPVPVSMANSTLTSLYEFHDSLKAYHDARRKNEQALKNKHVQELWTKYYGPLLLRLLKQKTLYHVIAIGSHARAILDAQWFKWCGISCECFCERLEKGHIHLIGSCTASRGVRQRYFANVNKVHNIKVQERSSKAQRFIQMKDFQHTVSVFVYITREQPYYSRKTMDIQCKHANFLPYGINSYSQASQKKDFMTTLWNDNIFPFLIENGYSEEVTVAKEKYDTYKSAKAIQQARKFKKLDPTITRRKPSNDDKKKAAVRHGAVQPRAELPDAEACILKFAKTDPKMAANICDKNTAGRIVYFLQRNRSLIVGNIQKFVNILKSKKEDTPVMGNEQHGEELSCEEFNPVYVDYGDDRSNGQC